MSWKFCAISILLFVIWIESPAQIEPFARIALVIFGIFSILFSPVEARK